MNGYGISVVVNGQTYKKQVEPRRLLADFIRHDLQLRGTRVGCEHGVCGSCTVLLDGAPTRSCITLAVQADGCEVETVWDPPWDPSRMSEDARLALNMY